MNTPTTSTSELEYQDGVANLLNNEVRISKTPSVQYYFFDKTDILFSCLSGLAGVANRIPVNENTAYHFFSLKLA